MSQFEGPALGTPLVAVADFLGQPVLTQIVRWDFVTRV